MRRTTFYTLGQQTLFQRCYSEQGIHDFAAGYGAAGPNAFVQCEAKGWVVGHVGFCLILLILMEMTFVLKIWDKIKMEQDGIRQIVCFGNVLHQGLIVILLLKMR